MLLAPPLAEIALSFSTYRIFLARVARPDVRDAGRALVAGQGHRLDAARACSSPASASRTRPACRASPSASSICSAASSVIPALVGVFAVSRGDARDAHRARAAAAVATEQFGSILAGQWALTKKYWCAASCAATSSASSSACCRAPAPTWRPGVSYAMSKRFSKEPEKFGTGHVEGHGRGRRQQQRQPRQRLGAGAAVRHSGRHDHGHRHRRALHEGAQPGPTLFTEKASSMYAIYIIFIIANIIMIPLGIVMIRLAALRAARAAPVGDAGDHAVAARSAPSRPATTCSRWSPSRPSA